MHSSTVLTCDLDEAGMVCSIVFTTVKVTHTNTISKALVRHKLLMLSKNLLNGMLYKSKYIGPEALETGTIIELTGVEMVNLTPDNRHVFEDTLKVFLNHTLANVDPPVQITTVSAEARDIKINSRSIMNKPGTRLRHHDNLRRLYSDPTATVELYTTITGEYQPPPEVKFDIVVTDTLAQDAFDFVDNLRRQEQFKKVDVSHVVPVTVAPTIAPLALESGGSESNPFLATGGGKANAGTTATSSASASTSGGSTSANAEDGGVVADTDDLNGNKITNTASSAPPDEGGYDDDSILGEQNVEDGEKTLGSATDEDRNEKENFYLSKTAMIIYGVVGALILLTIYLCCCCKSKNKADAKPYMDVVSTRMTNPMSTRHFE